MLRARGLERRESDGKQVDNAHTEWTTSFSGGYRRTSYRSVTEGLPDTDDTGSVLLATRFEQDIAKLGGKITKMVAYNESQQSYRAEVTSAMEGEPDSLFLIAFPVDGATITREWLSLGGTDNLIVNNSLRSADYLNAVGSKHLKNLVGYDSAQPRVESRRQPGGPPAPHHAVAPELAPDVIQLQLVHPVGHADHRVERR